VARHAHGGAGLLELIEGGRDLVGIGAGRADQLFFGRRRALGRGENLLESRGERRKKDAPGFGGKRGAPVRARLGCALFFRSPSRAGVVAALLLAQTWLLRLQRKTGASNSPKAGRIASEISPSVA
jgi:hypothetical protein